MTTTTTTTNDEASLLLLLAKDIGTCTNLPAYARAAFQEYADGGGLGRISDALSWVGSSRVFGTEHEDPLQFWILDAFVTLHGVISALPAIRVRKYLECYAYLTILNHEPPVPMNSETRRPSRRIVVPPATALRRVTRLAKWTLRKWPEHPAVVASIIPFLMTGADPAWVPQQGGYFSRRESGSATLDLLIRLVSSTVKGEEHILEARVATVVFGLWRSRLTKDIEPMFLNRESGQLYRVN